MITKGEKLNDVDFDNRIIDVDELLKKSKNFNSPTYASKGLKSIDGFNILVKPTGNYEVEFLELLQPLNILWVDCELMLNNDI